MSNIPPMERPTADSTRRIDPEVEKAARKSDMPDGSVYDTDTTTNMGPSNFWLLGAVLIFIAVLVGIFAVMAWHWRG